MKLLNKERCKHTVARLMKEGKLDITDMEMLKKWRRGSFIMFGISTGVSALLYGLFHLRLIPICICAYFHFGSIASFIGSQELIKELKETEKLKNE